MVPYAAAVFATLPQLIFEEPFRPDFAIRVARALAEIYAAIPDAVTAQQREELCAAVARIVRETRVDTATPEDAAIAAEFFEGVLHAYLALVNGALEPEFAVANQKSFFEAVTAFIAARVPSPRNLLAFFALLRAIIEHVPGRSTIMTLHKPPISVALRECRSHCDPHVANAAKDTISFLRTYKRP
jgi:hypothetical protein